MRAEILIPCLANKRDKQGALSATSMGCVYVDRPNGVGAITGDIAL